MTIFTVGIGRLKENVSEWIRRVSVSGDRIILTSHGEPQAALISIQDLRLLEQAQTTRTERLAALESARLLGEQIRAGRTASDVDAVVLLQQVREGRDDELLGLR